MVGKPTIFLSSTWADLEEHRKAVLFTFTRLRKWVEAMEYFGALPGEPLEECLKAVRRADIYVGVIGTRYGSKDKDGVSITQREYEDAYHHRKTILVYLLDEENHPVLPKFVDTGEDAARLAAFKRLLKDRHICALFSSPQDLAVKIGVDLIHHLDLYKDSQTGDRTREFSTEIPKLLSKAGYSLGMQAHIIDLSGILEVEGDSKLEIRDPMIEEVVVAGYLAINVCRDNYNVLQQILTFDQKLWRLFINLARYYGVTGESLAEYINKCRDPMQFRLLARLAGDLALSPCAEPICQRLLVGPALDQQFTELRAQATPLRNVVRDALQSMPTDILPVVEKYMEKSKLLERWQQKRVFESAAKVLRRRLEESEE